MPIEDAYRDDLAYIHDAGFGAVASAAAAVLIEELRRAGFRSGAIVDLGCGSGILAGVLAEAGYQVSGIDASPALVSLARNRVPGASFEVGSFVDAGFPASVAVTAIGEVFSYAFDTENDAKARVAVFRRAYEALVPGGVFLFDVAGPGRVPAGGPHRTFTTGPDWAVLVETDLNPLTGVVTREITSFRRIGAHYRRDAEVHRLVLLDPAAVMDSLRAAGFESRALPAYGDVALPPGVVVLLGRKRVMGGA